MVLVRTSLDLKETTALINVYLKRLLTLIVFLMVVSSLVFWMRARHLTESTIPFYLVNCQTGESPNVIRILSYWYENQQMCVRWGGTCSTFFGVTNGVRQGSILSPYLFNIYVDDLSVALNACRVGCCVGKVIINHLMYADDLVILAPSVAGLSKLLSICEIFGESNDIIFNKKKSASLYFISKMLKGAHLPNVYLNQGSTLAVFRYPEHPRFSDGIPDSPEQ